ncbi:von Willebrand factor type A domain protein [Planctomycetes bacterium Pla163]|uniref:von Willebrand factor type A domain protein n=1 Tax=Rohdeia mirabilis TaxID=2528008 RepID=A0A518D3K5_9BACT|nr:von Willebrand factor type A domain protein [Planctomycetes bacterium Pla163]
MRSIALSAGLGTLLLSPVALAQNPNSGITNTGQQLTVEISCDDVLNEGATSFTVDACATLGPAADLNVNVLFVVDLSGSMGQNIPGGGLGDANGDGINNQRIDAAIEGLVSLAESLGSNDNVDLGIVAFGVSAATCDLDPAAGTQVWISPPDLGTPNQFETVLRSMDSNGIVGQFTPLDVGPLTNYQAAINVAAGAFALQAPGEVNLMFFISDGQPNGAGSTSVNFLENLANNVLVNQYGVRINTFGIGPGDLCAPGQILDRLAEVSGGTCTNVADPGDLTTVLPNAGSTSIESIVVSVNGNQVLTANGPEALELCLNDVEILQELDLLGINVVEATATAADGTQVTATKQVTKTMCQLFVGLAAKNKLLFQNDTDKLLVQPLVTFNVTESVVPTFQIPAVPELAGLDVYFQVAMHNEAAFPTNAVQMSNGVRVTLGGSSEAYGNAAGIFSWFDGSAGLGDSFEVRFDVVGM